MKKVKTVAEHHEQRCPACGGKFTIGSTAPQKKVRCPKCREIVTLTEAIRNGGSQPTAQSPAATDDWRTRCAMLQARIEVLEQQIESRKGVPPPGWPSLGFTQRLPDSSTVGREQLMPGRQPAEHSEASNEGGLGHRSAPASLVPRAAPARASADNPRPPPPHDVTLIVSAGDVAGRRIAETLKEVVARAGWNVRAVIEKQIPPDCRHGLTLAADPTLSPEQLTGMFNALRIAGFPVTLHLNPNLGPAESILMVGSGTLENTVRV